METGALENTLTQRMPLLGAFFYPPLPATAGFSTHARPCDKSPPVQRRQLLPIGANLYEGPRVGLGVG